jgi:hypothetical protein
MLESSRVAAKLVPSGVMLSSIELVRFLIFPDLILVQNEVARH